MAKNSIKQEDLKVIVEQGKKLGPVLNKNRVIDPETNAHFDFENMCQILNIIQIERKKEIESYGEVVTHPHTEKTSFGDPHRFGEYCGGNLSNWVEYSELNESCCDEAISQDEDKQKDKKKQSEQTKHKVKSQKESGCNKNYVAGLEIKIDSINKLQTNSLTKNSFIAKNMNANQLQANQQIMQQNKGKPINKLINIIGKGNDEDRQNVIQDISQINSYNANLFHQIDASVKHNQQNKNLRASQGQSIIDISNQWGAQFNTHNTFSRKTIYDQKIKTGEQTAISQNNPNSVLSKVEKNQKNIMQQQLFYNKNFQIGTPEMTSKIKSMSPSDLTFEEQLAAIGFQGNSSHNMTMPLKQNQNKTNIDQTLKSEFSLKKQEQQYQSFQTQKARLQINQLKQISDYQLQRGRNNIQINAKKPNEQGFQINTFKIYPVQMSDQPIRINNQALNNKIPSIKTNITEQTTNQNSRLGGQVLNGQTQFRIVTANHKKAYSTNQQPQEITQYVQEVIKLAKNQKYTLKGKDTQQDKQRFPILNGQGFQNNQEIIKGMKFQTSSSPPERPLPIHYLLKNNFTGQQVSTQPKPSKINSPNFNSYEISNIS